MTFSIARRLLGAIAALGTALALTGCGYNDFQRLDEQIKSAWSEVLNQYQRRADLIPNIVATVKGEANFEQETLTKVVEARAKATSHPGHARDWSTTPRPSTSSRRRRASCPARCRACWWSPRTTPT